MWQFKKKEKRKNKRKTTNKIVAFSSKTFWPKVRDP